MTRRFIELHPDAVKEARDGRLWFEQHDPAAAAGFMAALDHAIDLVAEAPDRWPQYLHGTHRVLLRRYPFSVIYRVTTDRIHVVAVAHQRRRPGYWRKR